MNRVLMMGRITNDLELSATPNGATYLNFRIAVDRNFQKKGEERKTDFFNVTAWRNTAEFISRYFGKGRMILIEGEFQTSQYTDKFGNQATWYELVVENAYFTGEKADGGVPSQARGYSQTNVPKQAASSPTVNSAPNPAGQTDNDNYPF